MMTLTGDDTLMLWSRIFNDFADDSVIDIQYPNDLVTIKTGKNQNTIYAKNEQGNNVTAIFRVMMGSADDKFLNTKLESLKENFAGFILGSGTFTKFLGDGLGDIVNNVYNLTGGIIGKRIEAQENVSGDTNQAVAIYNMKFALGTRSLT